MNIHVEKRQNKLITIHVMQGFLFRQFMSEAMARVFETKTVTEANE